MRWLLFSHSTVEALRGRLLFWSSSYLVSVSLWFERQIGQSHECHQESKSSFLFKATHSLSACHGTTSGIRSLAYLMRSLFPSLDTPLFRHWISHRSLGAVPCPAVYYSSNTIELLDHETMFDFLPIQIISKECLSCTLLMSLLP